MYVNKVGPYFNPHETYHYYQLPVCRPEKVSSQRGYCVEAVYGPYKPLRQLFEVMQKMCSNCEFFITQNVIYMLHMYP